MCKRVYLWVNSVLALFLLNTGTIKADNETSNTGVLARLATYSIIIKSADVNFGGIMIPQSGETVVHLNHVNVVSLVSGNSNLYNTYDWRTGVLNVMSDEYTTYYIQYVGSMNIINSKGGTLLYNPMVYLIDGTYVPSGTTGGVPDNGSVSQPGTGGFNPIGGVDNNMFRGSGQFLVGGNLTIPYTATPDVYYADLSITFSFQ